MSVINVKYQIGDRVYSAHPVMTRKQHDCPDCLGQHEWKAISPAGTEYTFACPRCSKSYNSFSGLSLSYSSWSANATPLTIGSIRTDTNDDVPVRYMCEETGVGSGTLHNQDDLFATKEEALEVSKWKAVELNTTTPHIKEQFDQVVSVSDYELSNAALDEARKVRGQTFAALNYKIQDLKEEISECSDMTEVLEILDREDELEDDK